MAINGDLFYQIIHIDECLTDDVYFLLRGFESKEEFIEGKTSPREGKIYIRYENDFKYPKSEYNPALPLRTQIYEWVNKQIIGDIVEDAVV